MANFSFKNTPTYGTCTTCGTSACADGFVDLVADTNVIREGYQIVGNIDVVLCADCVTQAARIVGCIPAREAKNLTDHNVQLSADLTKALDDIYSWQQRYENLVEIMSLLELSPKDASSDSNTEFVPVPEPKPDLRVQEGRIKPAKNAGKTAKRS